jgi:hypothetical protein
MKTTSVRLASLLLLTALGSLFLPAGCAGTCGDISQVSNTSSGSFQYTPAGGGGDERVSRGPLPPSSLEVDSTGSESFTITGYFTDGAMLSHDFTLILANVSGGSNGPIADGSTLWFADCSPGDADGACIYAAEATVPVSGDIEMGAFSSECHGSVGCALSAEGRLQANAMVGGRLVELDISVESQSTFQSMACSYSGTESS